MRAERAKNVFRKQQNNVGHSVGSWDLNTYKLLVYSNESERYERKNQVYCSNEIIIFITLLLAPIWQRLLLHCSTARLFLVWDFNLNLTHVPSEVYQATPLMWVYNMGPNMGLYMGPYAPLLVINDIHVHECLNYCAATP